MLEMDMAMGRLSQLLPLYLIMMLWLLSMMMMFVVVVGGGVGGDVAILELAGDGQQTKSSLVSYRYCTLGMY